MTPLFGSVISERTRFVSSAFPIQRFIYDIMLNLAEYRLRFLKRFSRIFRGNLCFPIRVNSPGLPSFSSGVGQGFLPWSYEFSSFFYSSLSFSLFSPLSLDRDTIVFDDTSEGRMEMLDCYSLRGITFFCFFCNRRKCKKVFFTKYFWRMIFIKELFCEWFSFSMLLLKIKNFKYWRRIIIKE